MRILNIILEILLLSTIIVSSEESALPGKRFKTQIGIPVHNPNLRYRPMDSMIYWHDFAGGSDSWTLRGSWGVRNIVNPATMDPSELVGVLTLGGDSPYPDGIEGDTVFSPVISLPTLSSSENLTMRILHWYDIETGDIGKILIKRGSTFTEVASIVGYADDDWFYYNNSSIISGFAGENIQICFVFRSDSYSSLSHHNGWCIAELQVFKSDGDGVPIVDILDIDASSFPTIVIRAIVKDAAGNAIDGLTEDDFQLLEKAASESSPTEEDITLVIDHSALGGASVMIIVDVSPSMSSVLAGSLGAATDFANLKNPYDRVGVVSFYGYESLLCSPTTSAADVIEAIASAPSGSATALYDGVVLGANTLSSYPEPRAIALFSDGGQNSGTCLELPCALSSCSANNITVYSLFYHSFDENLSVLTGLSLGTSGAVYEEPSYSDLSDIWDDIREGIGAMPVYLIRYTTHNSTADCSSRLVELKAVGVSGTPEDYGFYKAGPDCVPLSALRFLPIAPTEFEASEITDSGITYRNYQILDAGFHKLSDYSNIKVLPTYWNVEVKPDADGFVSIPINFQSGWAVGNSYTVNPVRRVSESGLYLEYHGINDVEVKIVPQIAEITLENWFSPSVSVGALILGEGKLCLGFGVGIKDTVGNSTALDSVYFFNTFDIGGGLTGSVDLTAGVTVNIGRSAGVGCFLKSYLGTTPSGFVSIAEKTAYQLVKNDYELKCVIFQGINPTHELEGYIIGAWKEYNPSIEDWSGVGIDTQIGGGLYMYAGLERGIGAQFEIGGYLGAGGGVSFGGELASEEDVKIEFEATTEVNELAIGQVSVGAELGRKISASGNIGGEIGLGAGAKFGIKAAKNISLKGSIVATTPIAVASDKAKIGYDFNTDEAFFEFGGEAALRPPSYNVPVPMMVIAKGEKYRVNVDEIVDAGESFNQLILNIRENSTTNFENWIKELRQGIIHPPDLSLRPIGEVANDILTITGEIMVNNNSRVDYGICDEGGLSFNLGLGGDFSHFGVAIPLFSVGAEFAYKASMNLSSDRSVFYKNRGMRISDSGNFDVEAYRQDIFGHINNFVQSLLQVPIGVINAAVEWYNEYIVDPFNDAIADIQNFKIEIPSGVYSLASSGDSFIKGFTIPGVGGGRGANLRPGETDSTGSPVGSEMLWVFSNLQISDSFNIYYSPDSTLHSPLSWKMCRYDTTYSGEVAYTYWNPMMTTYDSDSNRYLARVVKMGIYAMLDDTIPPRVAVLRPSVGYCSDKYHFDILIEVIELESGIDPNSVYLTVGNDTLVNPQNIGHGHLSNNYIYWASDTVWKEGNYTGRIELRDMFDNPLNMSFSFCVGTPEPTEKNEVFIYPSPYNPTKGNSTICLKLDKNLTVDILIYTSSGSLVKKVKGSFFVQSNIAYSVEWNGLDDNWDMLPNGVYMLIVKDEDEVLAVKKFGILR
jgi:hypothetical protein